MDGMSVNILTWVQYNGEQYTAPYHVLAFYNHYWFLNLN